MSQTLATEKGKEFALEALRLRREKNATVKKIDNASLRAGADMHFYCKGCGAESDVLPENYIFAPKRLCPECKALKDLGWLQ